MSLHGSRTALLISAILTALLVLTVAGLAASPASAHTKTPSNQRDLEATVRAATARYHDVAAAEAAGYVPVSDCVEAPGLGVMGVHFLHFGLVDDVIDVRAPEALLYLPTADGGMRLIGVEYFRPSQDQDETDGLDDHDRPFLGAVPFDGPMAGHGPGEPYHYDLHVWLWAHNPAGMYAQLNPSLSCPVETAPGHER